MKVIVKVIMLIFFTCLVSYLSCILYHYIWLDNAFFWGAVNWLRFGSDSFIDPQDMGESFQWGALTGFFELTIILLCGLLLALYLIIKKVWSTGKAHGQKF